MPGESQSILEDSAQVSPPPESLPESPVLVATLPHPKRPLLDNSMSPLPHQTLCSLWEDLVVSLSL